MRDLINIVENMSTKLTSSIMEEALKIVLGHLDEGGPVYLGIISDYKSHHDIEDDDYDHDNFDTSDPEFQHFVKDWVKDRIQNQWYELSSYIVNGSVIAYRMITAPVDFKPTKDWHPGLYWSWDSHNANAHWGKYSDANHVEWLIKARIPESSIDWIMTLAMKASPAFEEEDELRLKGKYSPVSVLSMKKV